MKSLNQKVRLFSRGLQAPVTNFAGITVIWWYLEGREVSNGGISEKVGRNKIECVSNEFGRFKKKGYQCSRMSGCFLSTMNRVSPSSGTLLSANMKVQ